MVYLFVLVLLVLLLQVRITGAAQVGLGELVAGKHLQAGQRTGDDGSQLAKEAVLQQLLGTAGDLCAAVSCTREGKAFTRENKAFTMECRAFSRESKAFTRKLVYTTAMNAVCRR